MKIFTSAFFALSLLITPSAWAAFYNATDVLATMQNDGRPRVFNAKAFVTDGDQNITIKVDGATEGKTLADTKGKFNIRIDMNEGIGHGHIDLKAVIYQSNLYLMIEDFTTGNNLDSINATLNLSQKKWAQLPLDGWLHFDLYQVDSLNMIVPGISELINEVLTLKHERFANGHAYRLGLDQTDQLLSSVLDNLQIRINTNFDDEFTYGRFYLASDLAALEMTIQRQYSPVYVPIPTQTVSYEQFIMELSQLLEQTPPLINELMGFSEMGLALEQEAQWKEFYGFEEEEDYDFEEEDYYFEEEEDYDYYEEPEDSFDYLVPGTNQTYDFYGNYCVSTSDIDRLNLQRKGICRVSNLRPRDDEREGSLSLRRQRVQAVDEQRRAEYRERVKAIQKNVRDWDL